MKVTVNLYNDSFTTPTRKWRLGIHNNTLPYYPVTPIWTGIIVPNGNFSNLDLLNDNSVELSLKKENAPINYLTALQANIIEVVIADEDATTINYHVIGLITGTEYINNNNVRINYKVDGYTSTMTTHAANPGLEFWHSCIAHLDRTHLENSTYQSMINLLPEPFQCSDTMRAHPVITRMFNEKIALFEGVEPTNDGLVADGMCIILTVSNAIREWGNYIPFGPNPTVNNPGLRSVPDFKFYGSDVYMHSGGVYKGIPLKFDGAFALDACAQFIQDILSGCGFRTLLPPEGVTGQDMVNNNQYLQMSNDGGGQTYYSGRNSAEIPLESVRFITEKDIYAVYCIPDFFAEVTGNTIHTDGQIIVPLPGLEDWTGLKPEDELPSKDKLLMYPYNYYKLVTANNDQVTIYPQVYGIRDDIWTYIQGLRIDMRYIGGDKPRLMMRLVPAFSELLPTDQGTVSEWFTVRNYPAIPISINDTNNAQLLKSTLNSQQLSAMHFTAVTQEHISSPFKSSLRDGYRNIPNRGVIGDIMATLGTLGNALTLGTARNNFINTPQQAMENQMAMNNASSVVTAAQTTIEGNDYITQISMPAVSVYACGASNAEAWSMSRYIDMYGTSVGAIVDPIDNYEWYPIWGGLSSICSNGFKVTFYQCSHIEINGKMPINWRNDMSTLFEAGCYLDEISSITPAIQTSKEVRA